MREFLKPSKHKFVFIILQLCTFTFMNVKFGYCPFFDDCTNGHLAVGFILVLIGHAAIVYLIAAILEHFVKHVAA